MEKQNSEFYRKMEALLPNLMREFAKRGGKELLKGKVSVPQMFILEILSQGDERIMSELASALSITTSAVTGLIDRMIKTGLVTRTRGVKDRRLVKIKIAKKGKTLIENILNQRRQMLRDAFGKLEEAERKKYLEILEKVYKVLTREK